MIVCKNVYDYMIVSDIRLVLKMGCFLWKTIDMNWRNFDECGFWLFFKK